MYLFIAVKSSRFFERLRILFTFDRSLSSAA
jgi:hypothetical protein